MPEARQTSQSETTDWRGDISTVTQTLNGEDDDDWNVVRYQTHNFQALCLIQTEKQQIINWRCIAVNVHWPESRGAADFEHNSVSSNARVDSIVSLIIDKSMAGQERSTAWAENRKVLHSQYARELNSKNVVDCQNQRKAQSNATRNCVYVQLCSSVTKCIKVGHSTNLHVPAKLNARISLRCCSVKTFKTFHNDADSTNTRKAEMNVNWMRICKIVENFAFTTSTFVEWASWKKTATFPLSFCEEFSGWKFAARHCSSPRLMFEKTWANNREI